MPKFSNGKRFFRNPDTGRFESFTEHEEELAEEIQSEATDDEDELVDLWQAITGEMDSDAYADAVELFRAGWVDVDGDEGDDVIDAREAFFELMDEYDISRDEFDWDAWRDWYESD